MDLFSRLRSLCAQERFNLEDIHSEIVAQVLRDSIELTLAWLKDIGATNLRTDQVYSCKVTTQAHYPALNGHKVNSRPDIVIQLASRSGRQLIFVESKIGSAAGDDQLERYADHLANELGAGFDRASLIFITRVFETDYTENLLPAGKCLGAVKYHQTRWFHFHRILLNYTEGNTLAEQLVLFMNEHQMNRRNCFRASDLVALENFLPVKALMDETLCGKVRETMDKNLGCCSELTKTLKNLSEESWYRLYQCSSHGKGGEKCDCFVGYWFPDDNSDEPVWVGLQLYCTQGFEHRAAYIAAFREWVGKRTDWESTGLDDPHEWCMIYKGRSLASFLIEKDHVASIEKYLVELVDEIAEFFAVNPTLPWRQ